MDVPAPVAGVVAEVLVKVGDRSSEGTPVVVAERERRGGRDARRPPRPGAVAEPRVAAEAVGAPGGRAETEPPRAEAPAPRVGRRRRAGLRQPVGAPAGARAGRRRSTASRAAGARGGSSPRTCARRPRAAAPAAPRRAPAATAASTCCRGPRSTSPSTARSSASSCRGSSRSRRPTCRATGSDPARHPQRRGRHHRPGGVPQAAQRRADGRQGDDGRAAAEGASWRR